MKFWAVAFSTLAIVISAHADTVTLKNGDKLDGKITAETDSQVTIEYHVSASIMDTRVVAKSDILKVDKEALDEQPYQAIKDVKPGPDSLQAKAYEVATNRLMGFLAQFPKSAHATEIQHNLDAEQAEKKRVDGGEVKINNRWFTKDEADKERVQLEGQAMLNFMKDQARRGDLVGALNTFDQLEKRAVGSRAYPEAIDTAKQLVVTLRSTATQALQTAKYQKAERDKGIQLASATEKAEIAAANDQHQKQEDAQIAAATQAGLPWPPMLNDNEKVLTSIIAKTGEAERRLAGLPVQKMRQSVTLSEAARAQIEKGDYVAADSSLQQARSLWEANELAVRLAPEVQANKGKTPPPAPEPEKNASTSPAGAPARNAAAPSGTATPSDAAASEKETHAGEEKPNFFFTPVGIVVSLLGIIFLLGLVAAYRKVAGRANEILE